MRSVSILSWQLGMIKTFSIYMTPNASLYEYIWTQGQLFEKLIFTLLNLMGVSGFSTLALKVYPILAQGHCLLWPATPVTAD